MNDLSEDMRKELDNIYEAIAALSVKVPEARKPAPAHRVQTPEGREITVLLTRTDGGTRYESKAKPTKYAASA